jgi:hypothetical protein
MQSHPHTPSSPAPFAKETAGPEAPTGTNAPSFPDALSFPDATPEGVPIPSFEPWRGQRVRLSGWTADAQRAFIAALTRIGCANAAAKMVGKSRRSAYLLREKPGAESFAAAWETAVLRGRRHAQSIAISRALHGDIVPQFRAGRFTGYKVLQNDRLLIAAISAHAPFSNRAGLSGDAALSELRYRLERWETALQRKEMDLTQQARVAGYPDLRTVAPKESGNWDDAWESHVIWREEIQREKRAVKVAKIRALVRKFRTGTTPSGPSVRIL